MMNKPIYNILGWNFHLEAKYVYLKYDKKILS